MSDPADREAGPILGLDLGQARIGVAISDPGRRVAVPLGTIRTGAPADVKAIAELVRANEISAIVVGLPLTLSGEVKEAADHARRFAEALRGFMGIPVHLQDERLTTVEAERGLSAAGLRGRERREVVDQAAATLILQAFLDRSR
ncbi:MAG: Holliday junction resolvase RuvX [Actinobacteria bacterium]|nr:MAG: Holliday junction resolvase RuvX [Actinomycetota bacterium]